MNNFEGFELSGSFKKIDSDEEVILTDQYGNLEGWTSKIGDKLCLDELSLS